MAKVRNTAEVTVRGEHVAFHSSPPGEEECGRLYLIFLPVIHVEQLRLREDGSIFPRSVTENKK